MKNVLVVSLVVLLVMSLSVFAQEKQQMEGAMKAGEQEETMGEMPDMTPPAPLSGDWYDWMVGEWEGATQSPMGKSKDWMKIEWALDRQYLTMHYKGETVEANEEMMKQWQEQMNLSDEEMEAMKNMKYKGMGVLSEDPKTGNAIGWWFDNWRGVYKGSGAMAEGNKKTMVWEGAMGTETRTTERVDENKMIVKFKSSGPMGEFEGTSELTRVTGSKEKAAR